MRGRSCSSTFEVLFVFLLYNRSQLTRRRSKAFRCSKQQMYKKINDTAKISLPLSQIIHQRAWLLFSILFDIAARTLNTGKEFRKLKRHKLQIFSSIFFYLFVLFIYLSYIYLICVFIYLLFSALRIRCLFPHFTDSPMRTLKPAFMKVANLKTQVLD